MKQPLSAIQKHFEAALPRIETHAKVYFRAARRNPEKFEYYVEETKALAWAMYLAVAEKGEKNPDEFISTIADYAAKHVKEGRFVNGAEKSKDVLSPRAQRRRSFTVQSLPVLESGEDGNDSIEALADTHNASPADQAAFRQDTPLWLERLGPFKRPVVEDMMQNYTTQELAVKHKKSQGRISQLRREALSDYEQFHALPEERGR